MKKYIGIHVRATQTIAFLFGENLEILSEIKIVTRSNDGKEIILQDIFDIIQKLKDDLVVSIGVAWAGFIDSRNGVVLKSPHITGFDNVHLTKIISERFQIPVFLENGTKLFAYTEQQIVYHGCRSLLGIMIGTGVGCGIVINGDIFRGTNGNAGEIGHTLPSLSYESRDLEQYFSEETCTKMIKDIGFHNLKEFQEKATREDIEKLSKFIEMFLIWIYNLILTFDPERIIFGGSVGKNIIAPLLPYVEEKLKNIFEEKGYPYSCLFGISQLRNTEVIGAGVLAKNHS